MLPSTAALRRRCVGPTFWFGGTGRLTRTAVRPGFEELQFIPNAVVSKCNSNGGSSVKHVPSGTRSARRSGRSTPRPEAELPRAGGVQRDADATAPPAGSLVMHAGRGGQRPLVRHSGRGRLPHHRDDLTTAGSGHDRAEQQDGRRRCRLSAAEDRQLARVGRRRTTRRTRSCGRSGTRRRSRSPAAQFCLPGQTESATRTTHRPGAAARRSRSSRVPSATASVVEQWARRERLRRLRRDRASLRSTCTTAAGRSHLPVSVGRSV